jgi:hypothetical protein
MQRFDEDSDLFDQPLYNLLKKFGTVVPEMKKELMGDSELITFSYVCYAMLYKVAKVELEWVNSLSLHLEFDNVRRKLKVFRFPSFCRLMYHQNTTLLSRYNRSPFRVESLADNIKALHGPLPLLS